MDMTLESVLASNAQVHLLAQPAYDAMLSLKAYPAMGLGAVAVPCSVDPSLRLVVAGFGWLRQGLQEIPVLTLSESLADQQIEALAWGEIAGCVDVLRAQNEGKARLLSAIARGCPTSFLVRMGIPASRDLTRLRRHLKLRPRDVEQPTSLSIFEQAKAKLKGSA